MKNRSLKEVESRTFVRPRRGLAAVLRRRDGGGWFLGAVPLPVPWDPARPADVVLGQRLLGVIGLVVVVASGAFV